LVMTGGIGLAMTPATNTIMSALPAAQFGVGSAVNSATREIGGALGVAVLGSIFAGSYAASMTDVTKLLPPDIAAIVANSLSGAAAVAERIGGANGVQLLAFARQAFVDAMTWTSVIGTVVALGGALIAFVWLPGRDRRREPDARFAETPPQRGSPAAAPIVVDVE
jgi:DHA2 family multidrug resistance protein-like MFS transporter